MYRENDKLSFHIAGVNGIDASKYPNYKSNIDVQENLFHDFTNNLLKGNKKGTVTDKNTGIKVITEKEININEKNLELSYISINDLYNKIFKKD